MSAAYSLPQPEPSPVPEPKRDTAGDDLNRGILFTRISPRLARAMTGLFLAAIFTVPVVQVTVELARGQDVQALAVFRQVPTKDNLHGYEKELDRRSVVIPSIWRGLPADA